MDIIFLKGGRKRLEGVSSGSAKECDYEDCIFNISITSEVFYNNHMSPYFSKVQFCSLGCMLAILFPLVLLLQSH